MKKLSAFFSALALPFLCIAQFNSSNLKMDSREASPTSVATPPKEYFFGNMKLFPIYASLEFVNANRNLGKFTSLRAAQDKNQVKITEHVAGTGSHPNEVNAPNNANRPNNINLNNNEDRNVQRETVGGGESVNTLFIENVSRDTVYIMAGEVIKGGKQDRVIAQDMILPPNSGQIDLSVFCVEHGRWTYSENADGVNFKSANYIAPTNVRKEVEVSHDQSQVWQSVATNNSDNGTASNSGALTANENNEKFQNELKAYVENPVFKNFSENSPQIVGVVAVTGNRVIGCDIFATHQLFAAQFQPLLNSYAAEAVTNGEPVKMDRNAVQAYLDQFLLDESKQNENMEGSGKVYEFETKPGVNIKTRLTKF